MSLKSAALNQWQQIHELAVACQNRGELEAALQHHLQALAQAKLVSDEHPELAATSQSNLSSIYAQLRQYEKAEQASLNACELFETAYGADDWNVGMCLGQLALVLQQQGKREQAAERYFEALKTLEQSASEVQDPAQQIAQICVNLADCSTTFFDEYKYARRGLLIYQLYGIGDPLQLMHLKVRVAHCEFLIGDYERAEHLLRRILSELQSDQFITVVLEPLGLCLMAQERYDEAQRVLEDAYGYAEQVDDPVLQYALLFELADCSDHAKEADDANYFRAEANKLLNQILQQPAIEVNTLIQYSETLQRKGKLIAADTMLRTTAQNAAFTKRIPPEDKANLLEYIANMYFKSHKWANAEHWYKQVLIALQAVPNSSARTAKTFLSLSHVYARQKKLVDAEKALAAVAATPSAERHVLAEARRHLESKLDTLTKSAGPPPLNLGTASSGAERQLELIKEEREDVYIAAFGQPPEKLLQAQALTNIWSGALTRVQDAETLYWITTTFGMSNPDMPPISTFHQTPDRENRPAAGAPTVSRIPMLVPPGLAGFGYELLVMTEQPELWPFTFLEWALCKQLFEDVNFLALVDELGGVIIESVPCGDKGNLHFILCEPRFCESESKLRNGSLTLLLATRITDAELGYAKQFGVESLVDKLEAAGVGQASDVRRPSAI